MFVLSSWLRSGMREIISIFMAIEEPLAKNFSLKNLLDIVGLDIPIDDPIVKELETRFKSMVQ